MLWKLITVATLLSGVSVQAQSFPTRPIRIVLGIAPGGGTDIVSRAVGQKLTERWGQQIVVEARPGAAGLIGTEVVARAQPDGYTLSGADMGSVMISWLSQQKPPFDYLRDLTPVMVMAYSPHVLCVHPSLPVKGVKELVALVALYSYAPASWGSSF